MNVTQTATTEGSDDSADPSADLRSQSPVRPANHTIDYVVRMKMEA